MRKKIMNTDALLKFSQINRQFCERSVTFLTFVQPNKIRTNNRTCQLRFSHLNNISTCDFSYFFPTLILLEYKNAYPLSNIYLHVYSIKYFENYIS